MKRLLASLLSAALVLQASGAFAASETLELPFGGPPPRSAGEIALLESDDGSSGLPKLLRHKKSAPVQATGRRAGQGWRDAVSRARAENNGSADRGGQRAGSDGPRGSRGEGGPGPSRGGAFSGGGRS